LISNFGPPKDVNKKSIITVQWIFPSIQGLSLKTWTETTPSWPADRLTPNMLNSIRLSRNALLLEILKFGGHTN